MLSLVEVEPIIDVLRGTTHKTVNKPLSIYTKSIGSYMELAQEKFKIVEQIKKTIKC